MPAEEYFTALARDTACSPISRRVSGSRNVLKTHKQLKLAVLEVLQASKSANVFVYKKRIVHTKTTSTLLSFFIAGMSLLIVSQMLSKD